MNDTYGYAWFWWLLVRKETQVENKQEEKLVSSKGFDAPDINAFGNTFRDYDAETHRNKIVEEFYRQNHINQSVDFVSFIIDLGIFLFI